MRGLNLTSPNLAELLVIPETHLTGSGKLHVKLLQVWEQAPTNSMLYRSLSLPRTPSISVSLSLFRRLSFSLSVCLGDVCCLRCL